MQLQKLGYQLEGVAFYAPSFVSESSVAPTINDDSTNVMSATRKSDYSIDDFKKLGVGSRGLAEKLTDIDYAFPGE